MMKFLPFLASSFVLITHHADAQTIKRYTFESAIVHYKISGEGHMMGVKSHTSGTKSLYFKNYGNQLVEKSEQTIKQFANTVDERRTQTLKKIDNLTVYDVDFKQKKIIKTQSHPSTYDHQQGEKSAGTDKVLGLKCEIWKIMGTSQCLYKGQIPLWIESDIMGLKQKTIATDIKLNVAVADKHFELPKYSIEVLSRQTLLTTLHYK